MFSFSPSLPLSISSVKTALMEFKKQEQERFSHSTINTLIANRSTFYDQLLFQLWQQFELDKQSLCLVAVGGYGREEMFPLSDLDILILNQGDLSEKVRCQIGEFFQFLWDCGFEVGSSVRTVSECIEEGKKEITIATNLLESRYLTGEKILFDDLQTKVFQPDFWDLETFFNAKMAEKKARYTRYHNTAYNLEPDIKYSVGGLRDLHLIYWIALHHSKAKTLGEILRSGFIYPEEYEELVRAQQFLFKVRFALHLILKRYDNRLLFDRQVKVAELLGFKGEGNEAVEQLMKRFFHSLQTIRLICEMLTHHYQEHYLKTQENNTALLKQISLDERFYLQNNSICLYDPWVFQKYPESILQLFWHLTEHPDANIHSETLRKLHLALGRLPCYLSEIPQLRTLFLAITKQPNAIKKAFVPMHKYGVLQAYIPAWKGIVGLMQFDLFHNYTVDEHTLQVLLKLESFLKTETEPDHPVCCELFQNMENRTLLYLAALFHDIAKGRGGSHAELGAVDMVEFAQLHGFNEQESELMSWLVKSHLLMSDTAQRRDIHDPDVILHFTEQVKEQAKLNGLVCLTVADICATNLTLWNTWKRSLLATLFDYASKQLTQGMAKPLNNEELEQQNKENALKILQSQQLYLGGNNPKPAFWADCPVEYFLRNTPKRLAWHAGLLVDFAEDVLVKISNRFTQGGTEVFIYSKDRPNLFNRIVSVISNKNLSIHDAQIVTTSEGEALDTLIVTELDGSTLKFDRRRLLEQGLTKALKEDKAIKLNATANKKLQLFSVKTEIRFLNLEKTQQTELEITALDKAGLLAEISQIFADLKLNLLNAKISTKGEKAEDFFILSNQYNQALTTEEREQLQKCLLDKLNTRIC